ncbi:uncharacterized protein LOC131154536 isoform X2 [Malania oleifera]|uniref:uncharacterized protein LOC131154536 isoform X2 n=1 Tax=Malania oleifera TaxID=397392 RepID=UPI0025ADFB25|nr:uncharacterized protein LOC131154536 isoform X2 [Malania oleifera]
MAPETVLSTTTNGDFSDSIPDRQNPSNGETLKTPDADDFPDDIDSSCSTPYVSAPSSPGRTTVGFFYSAPASPMHFVLSKLPPSPDSNRGDAGSPASPSTSFEFEFSARFAPAGAGSAGGAMCSADELFLNGQIRPMKLASHLQRPQLLAPLVDGEEGEIIGDGFAGGDGGEVGVEAVRGRDLRLRDRSLRRRTRSLSPLRSSPPFPWRNDDVDPEDLNLKEMNQEKINKEDEEAISMESANASTSAPSMSASSSRSSSAGRSSRRWVFLKDFLYRSKSEGRGSNTTKFWSSMTFSPAKEKKINATAQATPPAPTPVETPAGEKPAKAKKSAARDSSAQKKTAAGKFANGVGKRRVPPSPHELHYTANRAQAEELRKKTFLPYKQGLLGCLGFSSRSYGAMNGFARALNPVSSR